MSAVTKAGDRLANRDGSPVPGPAMSFSAPFWVYEGGEAKVNYGDDEAAALQHYDRLVHARRVTLGIAAPLYVQ